MKKYLKQLASIREELEALYYMRSDIDDETISHDYQLVLHDCDKAVNTLLDTIEYYCK